MCPEPPIALEVKIHRARPNAVTSGGHRNDRLPRAVQQGCHHHDRQAVARAKYEWHLRADALCSLHMQGTRGALLKFSPQGFTDGTCDLAVANMRGIMKDTRLCGQHGGDHQLGNRIFRTTDTHFASQGRSALNGPGIGPHFCNLSYC